MDIVLQEHTPQIIVQSYTEPICSLSLGRKRSTNPFIRLVRPPQSKKGESVTHSLVAIKDGIGNGSSFRNLSHVSGYEKTTKSAPEPRQDDRRVLYTVLY